MAFFSGRGGFNPRFGRDTGPPPPINTQGSGGHSYFHPQQAPIPIGFFGQPQPMPAAMGQPAFAPRFSLGYPPGAPARPTVWPFGGTMPANPPLLNASLPAANMVNSTGGVGCEPGYHYFFHAEHTKIHVLETGDTPPWLLPPNSMFRFHAAHIPANTTLGDLLKGFGACNPDPQKNRVFEVHQGGEGKWYKGMCFTGDNQADMNKTIKSIGWDATRTGLHGEKPVVYLYVTKG